jgi:hypothetical protein
MTLVGLGIKIRMAGLTRRTFEVKMDKRALIRATVVLHCWSSF